jgi:hypothetical protein
MQLCIHSHGIELTDSLKRQTYEKLEFALDRLEEKIRTISVYLFDTNGPLVGGVDKACRIIVQIRDQESIVVEDCDERVDVVIERITDRLGVVACQRIDTRRRAHVGIRSWLIGESHDEQEFHVYERMKAS